MLQRDGRKFFYLSSSFFLESSTKVLKARFGSDGVMLYLYLLCEVYRENGYYFFLDEDLEYVIADEQGIDHSKFTEILSFLLKKGLFDAETFTKYRILTSQEVQATFQRSVKEKAKKNPVIVEGSLWLLPPGETEGYIQVISSGDRKDLQNNQSDFPEKTENFPRKISLEESTNTPFQSQSEFSTEDELYVEDERDPQGILPDFPEKTEDFPRKINLEESADTLFQSQLKSQLKFSTEFPTENRFSTEIEKRAQGNSSDFPEKIKKFPGKSPTIKERKEKKSILSSSSNKQVINSSGKNAAAANSTEKVSEISVETTQHSCRYEKIEQEFSCVTGRTLSARDRADLDKLLSDGIDDDTIISTIQRIASRKSRAKINSFWYFAKIIYDERESQQNALSTRRSSRDSPYQQKLSRDCCYPSTFDSADVEVILNEEFWQQPVGRDEDYTYDDEPLVLSRK